MDQRVFENLVIPFCRQANSEFALEFQAHSLQALCDGQADTSSRKPPDFNTLIHPDDLPRLIANWRDSLARQQPYQAEYRLRCLDGSQRLISEFGRPAVSGQIHGLLIDISETVGEAPSLISLPDYQQQLEATETALAETSNQLSARDAELMLLNDFSASLHLSRDLDSIAALSIDTLRQLAYAEVITFYQLDDDQPGFQLLAAHGVPEEYRNLVTTISAEHSMSARAIQEHRVLHSPFIDSDTQVDPTIQSLMVQAGYNQGISIPLVFKDKSFGVINLALTATAPLPYERLQFLGAIGQTIGLAIENMRNLEQLQKEIEYRKRAEQVILENEERYRNFIANSSEGIYRIDIDPPVSIELPIEEQVQQIAANATINECNRALAHMYGLSIDAIQGRHITDLYPAAADHIRELIRNNYRQLEKEALEFDDNGREFWVSDTHTAVIRDGMLVRIWGVQRDITESKEHMVELEHQANHDALTSLPNRKNLLNILDNYIHTLSHANATPGLLLIDLDRFKEINDTLGHQCGDTLLRQIGPRLKSLLIKRQGILARLGGDEFAVLLPHIDSEQAATEFAQEMLEKLRTPFLIGEMSVEIGGSIGIALAPQHGGDATTLLRCADVAMYVAKEKRVGVFVYDSKTDRHSPFRLSLMTELGRAIRSEQLTVYYQPKIDLDSGRIEGFEALVRWVHPRHGLIPPNEFIPLAEMSDQIGPLTSYVINAALKQWRHWHDQGYDLRMAINLSARNLVDEGYVEEIEKLIQTYEVPAHHCELEITESALMEDPDKALVILERLHALGIDVAIDDFGTGYSSLAYLRQLPLECLKIDRTFVMDMLNNRQDHMIVDMIIGLARNLDLQVTAEGVEDEETYRVLRDMGCAAAQGFYMSPPKPAHEIDAWASDGPWRFARRDQAE